MSYLDQQAFSDYASAIPRPCGTLLHNVKRNRTGLVCLSHNISITSANPFHDYVFVFTFCIPGCRLSTDFSAVVLPQHLSPKIAPSEIIKTTLRKTPMTNCPAPIIYMVRRLQPTLPVHKYSSSFIFTSGILIHHLCLLTMMMIHIAMGMMMMDEPPFHYIVMMKHIVTAR